MPRNRYERVKQKKEELWASAGVPWGSEAARLHPSNVVALERRRRPIPRRRYATSREHRDSVARRVVAANNKSGPQLPQRGPSAKVR